MGQREGKCFYDTFRITLPFHLEWKLPFWHLKLPSSRSAFLQVDNPLSDEQLLKQGYALFTLYAHGLRFFQLLWMFLMCEPAMGPRLQELQSTALRGKGKAHWTLMTQCVDLGALLRHLRESLQKSVNFFQDALRSTRNKSPQISGKYHSSEIHLKKITIQNFLSCLL